MMSNNLVFKGNAEKALNFYAKVFGYMLGDNDIHRWENGSIAHGEISIYNSRLMFTDIEEDVPSYTGFSLSINLNDKAELTQRFDALNVNAEVLMPLQKTDWSDCYGLIKDQFGVTWQFNLD